MTDLQREVWEGWTPQNFIDSLSKEISDIMTGLSFLDPFKTKEELNDYILNHQPYYKRPIPEVNEYFLNLYDLK
ncbi:hypothetical protein AGMMS49975_11930 [Clostridia bacterium]|nr:hypothetical protein AGMMS49975_11930 [Clostridia bacterium]